MIQNDQDCMQPITICVMLSSYEEFYFIVIRPHKMQQNCEMCPRKMVTFVEGLICIGNATLLHQVAFGEGVASVEGYLIEGDN